jgi:hypothetical protein
MANGAAGKIALRKKIPKQTNAAVTQRDKPFITLYFWYL